MTSFFIYSACCWRANVQTLTAFLEWIEWSGLNVDASLASGYGGSIDVKLPFHSLRPQIAIQSLQNWLNLGT